MEPGSGGNQWSTRSNGEKLQRDLLGGQIAMMFTDIPVSLPPIKSGALGARRRRCRGRRGSRGARVRAEGSRAAILVNSEPLVPQAVAIADSLKRALRARGISPSDVRTRATLARVTRVTEDRRWPT